MAVVVQAVAAASDAFVRRCRTAQTDVAEIILLKKYGPACNVAVGGTAQEYCFKHVVEAKL